MHELGHIGIARLDGKPFAKQDSAREAGLQGGVELAFHRKAAEVQSIVEFDSIVETPIVAGVEGEFSGWSLLLVDDGVDYEGVVH